MDYFIIKVSEQEIKREKEKARELRHTQWWKNRVAKGICHYCGGAFPPAELTMDHLFPIVRGGKSARGNVAPACKECNNRKKHMLPLEWEEDLKNQDQDQDQRQVQDQVQDQRQVQDQVQDQKKD